MAKSKIIQINNDYIKNEQLKQRYDRDRHKRQHRFLGLAMFLLVLLFILPSYGLMNQYHQLKVKKAEIVQLKKDFEAVKQETKQQQELAKRLQNDEYVEKYARAKYYYSLEGEIVYLLPDLVPK